MRLSTSRSSIDSRCFTPGSSLSSVAELHELDAVVPPSTSAQPHADVLADAGGEVLAHEVGPDGQLPVAAVDEDRELDRPGATELGERVHGGAHGAAGVEHVVDEHHDPAGDVDGDLGGAGGRDRPEADVVAVEGDVEGADGDVEVLELRDGVGEAAGDGQTPGVETHEHDVVGATVALHDLVGDPGLRAAEVAGVEHAHACASFRRSLTGLPSRSRPD